ncbi:MAG: hypothetical protein EOM15_05570 [Spirochaetia bacterium]|nr:hypothetical protein [Spirochaetia bacterium]
MNNLQWYKEVLQFCQLSKDCKSCPYNLLTGAVKQEDSSLRPCFSSKEALLALGEWLQESNKDEEKAEACAYDGEDNQWLKDLLRGQFPDELDEDLFIEDDFI